jgi:hypothetical protein
MPACVVFFVAMTWREEEEEGGGVRARKARQLLTKRSSSLFSFVRGEEEPVRTHSKATRQRRAWHHDARAQWASLRTRFVRLFLSRRRRDLAHLSVNNKVFFSSSRFRALSPLWSGKERASTSTSTEAIVCECECKCARCHCVYSFRGFTERDSRRSFSSLPKERRWLFVFFSLARDGVFVTLFDFCLFLF